MKINDELKHILIYFKGGGFGFGSEGWSRRGCDYACAREGTLPVFSWEYILIELKMTVGVYIIINK